MCKKQYRVYIINKKKRNGKERKRKGMKSSKNFFGFNLHAFVYPYGPRQDASIVNFCIISCLYVRTSDTLNEEEKKQFMWVAFVCVCVGCWIMMCQKI